MTEKEQKDPKVGADSPKEPARNASGPRKESKNTGKKTEGGDPKAQGPKMPKFNAYWIYGLILIALIVVSTFNLGQGPQNLSYSVFVSDLLPSGDIKRVVVIKNEGAAEVTIAPDAIDKYRELFKGDYAPPAAGPHFNVKIPTLDSFEEARKAAEETNNISIPVEYEERVNFFKDFLSMMWPLLLIIIIWIFIFRRMSSQGGGGGAGNIFSVGKSKAKMFDKEDNINVNFGDVAGLSEAKQEVEEIVEFLKKPEKFTELGGKIPKGALLIGPPGTGKTLLAKAVAGEANVPFFSMSGSDFVEMFVGVGASRVRDLFRKAKEKAPCIVFIDEIDAIGRARGKNAGFSSNDERENTLNQLLTEMDGFGSNSGVIILAATNRADVLDRALMRAGRFDRQIAVELPDMNEREQIFKVHLRPLRLKDDVDPDFLAKQTPGFSGADIANVCNEAALIAARRNKKLVEKDDFLDAVDRIVGGLEKKNKIISKDEKRAIAYHEAGHAVISWLLEYAHPLVKVTIVPRGKALGAAWYLPEERQLTTSAQILDEMCSALGGRAAEELIFNQISTGALNDLEKVTRQAYAMVSYFGMSSKVGNISFFDSSGQSEYSFHKPYSEKTAELIDHEASAIVEEQYNRAKKILTENKEKHSKLAELLLEKEVIFSEDLEGIFGKRKGPQHVIPSNGGSNEGDDSAEKNNDTLSKNDKPDDAKSEGSSEPKDKNDSENKE
ncbi:ATP-dependent zinc metalloprotease FtsH [Marinilabilia salmonicolor]|jgi:cell division protease FtsH|uniref:ATP-dependent zinc metalloprotease FtsH n=1 Tax=Marinilabilia salmonicolor TaxID=989 RepID=A0A2T0XSX3_9BACT|nr:ATP-dependent zinc metalloprotease FtsH [Marinilabilia salmonicolor]PRZ02049.1 cell division protease FtsH [Marinilabilia salmonicolor]RCW39484.1 cell division protease FtsH [Marinilabilia salmonicolor]